MENSFYGYPVLGAHFGHSPACQTLTVDVRGVVVTIYNDTRITTGYSVNSEMGDSIFADTIEKVVDALTCVDFWKHLKDLGHNPSAVEESGDLYKFTIDGVQYTTNAIGQWPASDDWGDTKNLKDIPVRDSNWLTWVRTGGKLVATTSRGETGYIFVRDEDTGESFVLFGSDSVEVVTFGDDSEMKEFLAEITGSEL